MAGEAEALGASATALAAEQFLVAQPGRLLVADGLDPAELDRLLGDSSDVRRPLGGVGLQEVLGRSLQHEIELPGEVVGVPEPGAHALAEERRHLVGGVAGEQDPTLFPLLGDGRAERVRRGPDQLGVVPRDPAGDPAPHFVGVHGLG